MHPHEDIFENRKQFQLERLILFSDAVFAIAITLLVLEIKIPVPDWNHLITAEKLNESLLQILPQIAGFVFSFLIIGFYWTVHHRVFGYVTNFDGAVIWLNLLVLLFVVLLPFSTALTSEYGYISESFVFYWIDVGCIGLILFFLQLHISNPNKKLSIGLEDINFRRYTLSRGLIISLIFFLGALFCSTNVLFLQVIGRFIYVLVFPTITILKRVFGIKKKRTKPTA